MGRQPAVDLIEMLEHEARDGVDVALVVHMPEAPAEIIWAEQANRLPELERALRKGGAPVGFIRPELEKTAYRVLEGHDDPEWAEAWLDGLVEKTIEVAAIRARHRRN